MKKLIPFLVLVLVLMFLCRPSKRPQPPVLETTVHELQAHAKTGDIVLFQWHEAGPSRLVSHMSHVGVIERRGSNLLVWEAHAAGDASYLGVKSGGIHVHPLTPRLRGYDGMLAWSPLRTPLTTAEDGRLLAFLGGMHGTAFDDEHTSRFIKKCLLGLPVAPNGTMFCSEFVAAAFEAAIPGHPRKKSAGCHTPDDVVDLALHHPPYLVLM